jgi:hypothetical protein
MLMQMTAVEFRDRYDGEGMFEHFRTTLVLPHLDKLRGLRPLHPTWGSTNRAPVQ